MFLLLMPLMGLANRASSIAISSDATAAYVANPSLSFAPSTEEKRVWFAIEIVNPTSRDALIVGFATSCQCTTIYQALPTPLPRGQSRFLTGSVDTSDLTSEIIIDSQVFIDTTQSDSTRFRVKISPGDR